MAHKNATALKAPERMIQKTSGGWSPHPQAFLLFSLGESLVPKRLG